MTGGLIRCAFCPLPFFRPENLLLPPFCSLFQYGFRPFPPVIPSAEFSLLRDAALSSVDAEGVSALDEWFRPDSNSLVPTHVLLPADKAFFPWD